MAKISITKEAVDPFFNNVSLLLPFDGSFNDASNNNFTVTANGNVQISSAQSKFGGSSAYFNGNDYLVINENSAFNLGDGSNYTVEMWVNMTSFQGQADAPRVISFQNSSSSWGLLIDPGNSNGNLVWNNYGTSSGDIIANNAITLNTWSHIALVKNGSRVSLYIDGTERGFRTDTNAMPNGNTRVTIAGSTVQFAYQVFYGYIDDLRITKGVARYTSNFTPPDKLSIKSGKLNIQGGGIDPFFNNVSLLLPMDTSFADFSKNNFTLTANGNVQISSAQSKFGGGSASIGGNQSSYITAPNSNVFQLAGTDWTIEFWVFWSDVTGEQTILEHFTGSEGPGWTFSKLSNNSLEIYSNYTPLNFNTSVDNNTWYHIAITRTGGIVRTFLNGSLTNSETKDFDNSSNLLYIGRRNVEGFNAASQHSLNGYIDDLRITKGVARYTANFTPPGPLFNIGKINISKSRFPMANLLAFWKLNDTSDSSGNNNNLTNINGVTFQPALIGNGARTAWGNNGSYLTTNLAIDGDATLSMWFKWDSLPVANPNGFSDRYPLVVQKYPYFAIYSNSNYPRQLGLTDLATWGIVSDNEVFTVGEWCHIVTTFENGHARVYANGNLILETPSGRTNGLNSGGRLLGWGGDNVDAATSYGTDTNFDAIGIWDRVLTMSEIQALYNNGAGLEP